LSLRALPPLKQPASAMTRHAPVKNCRNMAAAPSIRQDCLLYQ
jgi:hypothetical protein